MARIVTLNNLSLDTKPKEGKELPAGVLQLNAIAKTFRYLDPEEVAEQRKAANDKKKGAKQ